MSLEIAKSNLSGYKSDEKNIVPEQIESSEKKVENRKTFQERLKKIEGLSNEQFQLIDYAYDLSKESHRPQSRRTGERYFEHPRDVTLILIDECGVKDPDIIISSLLHDSVEDAATFGNATLPYSEWVGTTQFRLSRTFDEKVSGIVTSLTKPKVDGNEIKNKQQAHEIYMDGLKKADPATILVKMADRLHNLRTLRTSEAKNRIKQLKETQEVYIPLFERNVPVYPKEAGYMLNQIKKETEYLQGSLEISTTTDETPKAEINAIDFIDNFSLPLHEELNKPDFDLEKFDTTKEMAESFKNEIFKKYESKQNRDQIISALNLMLELHKDQADRPDGQPYVNHPLEVAISVNKFMNQKDPDLVIAALLHDSIEDQNYKLALNKLEQQFGPNVRLLNQEDIKDTFQDEIAENAMLEIKEKYGDKVAKIIQHLSNPNFKEMIDKLAEKGIYKTKNELYKEHVEEAIKDSDVLIIKLADFSKNGMNLTRLAEGPRKDKLTKKYTPVFKVFIDRLQDESLLINDKENIVNKLNETYSKLTTVS